MSVVNGIIATILLFIALIIYSLPAVIARIRGHHNSTEITVTNLFLGWTFIGWEVPSGLRFG